MEQTKEIPEVTKGYMLEQLKRNPHYLVGRALVAIHARQTDSEQRIGATFLPNNIGFSKPDARLGSVGAKQYLAKGRLEEWVIKYWCSPTKSGFPKICKYHKQLNEIAQLKLKQQ